MLEMQLEEADEQIGKVKAGLDRDEIPAVAMSDEDEPDYPPLSSDAVEALDSSTSTTSSESEADPLTLSNSPSGQQFSAKGLPTADPTFRMRINDVGEGRSDD